VPSLHRPVASDGLVADAAAVDVEDIVDFVFEDELDEVAAVSADVDFVEVEALSAAYHSLTPLWPWHAPFLLAAELQEPSLHWPVVPAGALAGAAAWTDAETKNPSVIAIETSVFTSFPPKPVNERARD
jgi:hypothetical protein